MRLLISAIFLLFFCVPDISGIAAAWVIEKYEPIFATLPAYKGSPRLAIRRFIADGQPMLLVVDAETLATSILADELLESPESLCLPDLQETPYIRALNRFNSPPYQLHNGGIRHAMGQSSGFFLTVDMCPSSRPYEREMFTRLQQLPHDRPIPVALAVTRLWMERHPEELEEILALDKGGVAKFTWINHSATHPYHPQEPLERNFLLSAGVDFRKEVLDTEQALLKRGLLPSPFFRFPGLVADGRLMEQLKKLGLIPVGSDAWLAKGKKPSGGSIILVHGNGNEPSGVRLLLEIFKNPEMRLMPLQAAFR